MSHALTLPARPSAARRSKVDRSRRILAGTATAATTLLLLWLVVAAMLGVADAGRSGLALMIEPPDSVVGVLPTIAGNAQPVSEAIGLPESGSVVDLSDLEQKLGALAGSGSSPKIVFLSAVGVSSSAGGGAAEPFFLPINGDPNDPTSMIPAKSIIGLLADRDRMGGPTLLILDVSHLDSDRGTAVYANGFLNLLEGLIPEDGDLLVLTSCAPGQVSWMADPFGRSVFADCVARSDAWGRKFVSDLHEDVAGRVASWARSHRDAAQTPLLLGNVRRKDFRLPPLRGVAPEPIPPAVPDELKARLRTAWEEHQAVARTRPDRVAPLPWRRYSDELLRAERLLRSGRPNEAELALNAVDSLASSLRQQVDAPPPANLPSFALCLAMAPPGARQELEREWSEAQANIRRVVDGDPTVPTAPVVPADPSGGEPDAPDPASGVPPQGSASTPGAVPGTVAPTPARPPNGERTRFAEALIADRYADFIRLGGESDDLRPARLEQMRSAIDVSIAAERAAAVDGRLLPWIEPIVAEGDQRRREGQDLLFSADLATIRSAGDPFREARARYDEAIALAEQLGAALELLQELADVLPYYGEWAASHLSRHSMLSNLLDDAALLSDRVAGASDGRGASGSSPAAPVDELRARFAKARDAYRALRRAFDSDVALAARPGSRPRWRTIDALLRVPMIPVDSRMALVEAATAAERSPLPAPDAVGSAGEEPAPDEAFFTRALGLARLELGLLRIAGEPVDELRGQLGQAEAWQASPSSAFSAMDSFSQGIRRHRDGLLATDLPADAEGNRIRGARDLLDRADWLARALPAATLYRRFGPAETPIARRADRDRHTLLVWHGQRLANDLAVELARDTLLAASVTGVDSRDLSEARLRLNRLQGSAVRVENLDSGDDRGTKTYRIGVSGGEELPPGKAAVLLQHNPKVNLRARPRGESIVEVPVRGNVERGIDISFAEGTDAAPTIYYRGRLFEAGRVFVPEVEQVSVAIRQLYEYAVDKAGNEITVKGRKFKVADQFSEHPDEGYLHPNSRLDYRLELTNWTSDPLPVIVSQRWGEGPAKETRLELPAGQSEPKAAVGQISSIDFGPEESTRTLTIEVREAGGLGLALCRPQQVVFRVLEPVQYIAVTPHFRGGRAPQVGLFVQHLDTDRTTVPANVTVAPEPFSAVEQLEAPQWIERGSYVTYRYRIVDLKLETLKFTLTVDGVPDAIIKEYTIQKLREEPPPPPPDDARVPKL